MILYEVNIDVRDAAYADYRAWLAVHVEHMLALPGFIAAEIFERREPPAPEGMRGLTVHCRLFDEAALERYLSTHASRMRAEGVQRFGDAFTATRRVMASLASGGATAHT